MHPAPFDLELYATQGLDAQTLSTVEQHLQTCKDCSDFLAHLSLQRDQLLAARPPAAFARNVFEKAQPAATQPRVWLPWMLTALATAAALLAIITWRAPSSDLRTMGAEDVALHLNHNGKVSRVGTTAEVHHGDALQVVLTLTRPTYVSIFFVDSSGSISWLVPSADNLAPQLSGPGTWTAPASAVFDASPKPEHIVVVRRRALYAPKDVAALVRAGVPTNANEFKNGAWLRDIDGGFSALFVKAK